MVGQGRRLSRIVLRVRLMVGQRTLDPFIYVRIVDPEPCAGDPSIMVRIQARQHKEILFWRKSANVNS